MSTSHANLDAAAAERKARLAKLASLKRKQPGTDKTVGADQDDHQTPVLASLTDVYISGRNYDIVSKGPKLGFESAPGTDVDTVERQADRLAASAKAQAEKDEAENEKGIDLFKLQPKKPNWDLKRELAEKMKVVDVRTQNAIARLVRERIDSSRRQAQQTSVDKNADGEEVGIEGTTLAEAVREREREDEQERSAMAEEDESP